MAIVETLTKRKNSPSRRNVWIVLTVFFLLWSANTAMVAMTIGPQDIYGMGADGSAPNPEEWKKNNPDRLGAVNQWLRMYLVKFDQMLSFPNSNGKTAVWTALVVFPTVIALYLVSLILTERRMPPSISGEVLWPRALLDISKNPQINIADFYQVSACEIIKNGPAGKEYESYKPLLSAIFGKPYQKMGELMAVPFLIKGVPVNQRLAVECLVAKDFPVETGGSGKIVSRRRGDHLMLTEEYPHIEGVIFEVYAFER
jgi:hypothetical protein